MEKSEIISKFSNIYIMLLYSIMTNDIARVKHFLSNDLYNKYVDLIEKYKKNNEQQMYDELNVYKIDIINQEIKDNKEIVTVKIISRYMDYVIDKNTGNLKSGINTRRIEKENVLVFEKKCNSIGQRVIYTCPNCSANIDVNFNGVCSYCRQSIDLKGEEYILVSINTL